MEVNVNLWFDDSHLLDDKGIRDWLGTWFIWRSL